jgi:radical SAM superfamily enzyme
LFKPKNASIITSRGCPFNCRFCARSDYHRKFRQRSAENVIKEFEEISDEYNSVIITDENFLSDVKRAHKIADNLIELDMNVEIMIQGTRVDTAEEGLYKKLKKAGVTFISFGIESGNQDVLDFYNKGITTKQIKKAVNLAHKIGFFTMGNFILGAPIENKEHIEKTIKLACSVPLDLAFFWPLCYFYGSNLWNEAVKKGKIDPPSGCYSILPDVEKNGLSNFKYDDIQSFCKKGYRRFYFNFSYIPREVVKAIKNHDFRLLRLEIGYI